MSCPHGVWHDKDCELCTLDSEKFERQERAEKAEAEIKRLKAELAKWEADFEIWKGEGAFG
jgi:hypothetical protein